MRPLSSDPAQPEAGAAQQATSPGGESVRADVPDGDRNGGAGVSDGPTVVDAQQLPEAQPPQARAASGKGALRRRLDRLRRERDTQLSELGTLVLDAKRQSPNAKPEIVDKRAAVVAELERQVAELSRAVEGGRTPPAVRVGIAGSCGECSSILATEDRFCPSCGTPTMARRQRPASPDVAPAAGATLDDAPPPTPGTEQPLAAAPPPTPGTEQRPTTKPQA